MFILLPYCFTIIRKSSKNLFKKSPSKNHSIINNYKDYLRMERDLEIRARRIREIEMNPNKVKSSTQKKYKNKNIIKFPLLK
jgi:hypothetical protein